jgi:hypothetical protein
MPHRYLALVAVALFACGCVPSLHPFYSTETATYESALLGKWVNATDNETWSFESEEDDHYRITFTDSEGLPGSFEAHLFKLSDQYFLDLYPEPPEMESNEFYLGHLLATHTLAHLELSDSGLVLAGMNPEWVEEHLDAHPDELAAERLESTLVLTAPTVDLQAFVLKYLDQPELFAESDHLVRPTK